MASEVPRIWEGSTCYIIGGGQSLPIDKIPRLRGQNVIAINTAYERWPWAPVLYFMDKSWYDQHYYRMNIFGGLIFSTCHETENDDRIFTLAWDRKNHHGPPRDQKHLPRGYSSGQGSINLAIMLGAKRIILLGYCFKQVNGWKNWHKDHVREPNMKRVENQFVNGMSKLADGLKDTDIEVINATPGSKLQRFPICDPEEVMPDA